MGVTGCDDDPEPSHTSITGCDGKLAHSCRSVTGCDGWLGLTPASLLDRDDNPEPSQSYVTGCDGSLFHVLGHDTSCVGSLFQCQTLERLLGYRLWVAILGKRVFGLLAYTISTALIPFAVVVLLAGANTLVVPTELTIRSTITVTSTAVNTS